jgi:hypothetical protein
LEGQLPPDWQTAQCEVRDDSFACDVTVPAGGWYRLEVRYSRGGTVLGECCVEHVGVGEVFIVAGQSNSANYGEERQKPTSDRVAAGGGAQWVIANDPQPGACGERGSFIPAFGDAMVKQWDVPIGIVSVGVGGTSVREWLPKGDAVVLPPTTGMNVVATGENAWAATGELFERLVQPMRRLGVHGFRAVLWHQGESDSHQPAGHDISPEQYGKYLVRLITATRETAGWRVPWFVAQASYHIPTSPGMPELRAVQKAVCDDGTAMEGPNTDVLKGEFREANGQGVHFNARGLKTHGELWATSVSGWLKNQLNDTQTPEKAVP